MKSPKQMNSYLRLLLYILATVVIFSVLAVCITVGMDEIRAMCNHILQIIRHSCPIIFWALFAILLIGTIYSYLRVEHLMKQEAQNLEKDIEDDALDYRIEAWITYTNFIGYLIFILIVILFVLSFPGPSESPSEIIYSMPPFVLICLILAVYNIAYVKQAQRRDPCKKGDPAQLRFNKDWLDSCDEAEKENTYQASYKALMAVNWTMPLFFLMAVWGHLMFQTGVMSIMIAGGIWGVMNLTYLIAKLKLLKTKLNQ